MYRLGMEGTTDSSCKSARRLVTELTAIFENLSEAVMVVDASGDALFVNRAGREIAGVSCGGWSVHDTETNYLLYPNGQPVPQEDRPALRLLAGKPLKNFELILVRIDGTQRRVTFDGALVDIDGRVVVAITFRDVTEMHRLEEVRQDLVRTVSHDLRNPLAVISAQAQILKRSLEAKGFFHEANGADVIAKASFRMAKLIEGLVDSTRLESWEELRPEAYERAPVDLASVARGLAERLNTVEPEARISVWAPAGIPEVLADLSRIEQALENLMTNALKYSPVYSPVLVSLTACDSEVIVSVRDEGVGIVPEELPKLFRRFYRASSSVGTEGLGLGLYIAKRTVEDHGGRIWVDSAPGKGSTFCFSLPLPVPSTPY